MTGKRWKNLFRMAFCLLAMGGTLFFVRTAYKTYLELAQKTGEYKTVLLKEPLTERDLETIREDENRQKVPSPFVLWKESSEEMVSRSVESPAITTALIRAVGDLPLLFQGNRLLGEKDTEGCLISDALAKDLFGSVQVLGLQLFYQGQTFTIRGVLPDNVSFFVLTGSPAEDRGFSYLSLSKEEQISEFLIRHSLNGKGLELRLLQDLSQLFLIVLPMGTVLLFSCFLFQNGLSSGFPAMVFWWGMAAVLIAGSFLFFRNYFYLPEGMIPDHWSNFSFWPAWWENIREELLFLIKAPKSISQTACVTAFFACAGSCVLSWLLAFISLSLSSIFSSTR